MWQLEGEEIDPEEQRRELKRLEQTRQDRLVAEELQGDLAHPGPALEREGEIERDGPAPRAADADKDLSLMMMAVDTVTVDTPLWPPSFPPAVDEQPGPSSRMSTAPAIQSIDGSPLEMAPSLATPRQLQHCWSGVDEEHFFTPPSSLTHFSLVTVPTTSPSTNLTLVTHTTPQNPPSPHPLHHFSPPATDHPSSSSSGDLLTTSSTNVLESDVKLAQQLQEEEEMEHERHEKIKNVDYQLAMALTREEMGEGEREALQRGEKVTNVDLDHHLAMELMAGEGEGEGGGSGQGEDVLERLQRQAEQSRRDAEVARALHEAEQQRGGGGGGGGGGGEEGEGLEEDIELARRLQNEESQLQISDRDEQLAYALQAQSSGEDTSHDEELARQIAAQFESTSTNHTQASAGTSQPGEEQLLARPPAWWTTCPRCPANSNRKYHLIDVACGQNEWLSVTEPLRVAGFTAQKLQRVQNMKLYQRLQFEKRSMKMDREEGEDYRVNETLLFHTSSAEVSTICSEGLDQRLARRGRFGSGVYFR